MKMNTDGSPGQGTERAVCGGIMRGHDAEFLGGFSYTIGSCGALEAELWGIYQGLKKAWEMD